VIERTILTYDGLRLAPDDGLRRELLGGELYLSPAPSPLHQDIVGEIFVALRAYAKQQGGKAYSSPIDVVFSQTDATQPDVIYLRPDRLSLIGAKYIQGAPSLIVEVMSPSSSDVDPGRKLETYAQYGVPEYWIVDPATRRAVAHAKPSGKRYLQSVASVDGVLAALTLPDLRFSILGNTDPA
jgi:Uma2 family endonuclease